MKFFRLLTLIILSFLLITSTSCSHKTGNTDIDGWLSPDMVEDSISSGKDTYSEAPKGDVGDYYSPTSSESNSYKDTQQTPAPGQITASAWSDIKNYDFWLELFNQNSENQENSFNNYFTILNRFTTTLNTQKMITVNITSDTQPINNYPVSIKNYNYSFNTKTDVFGNAYLFIPNDSEFPYTITYGTNTFEITSYSKETINLNITSSIENDNALDLMFVIDTTGSMGDEISYLKEEIKNVIERIEVEKENIRLGLLFYRYEGDTYITKLSDFTTDISKQINFISNQRASGGGDTPEAVDQALSEAINKASWSNNNNTKILVHVLDAPPHSTKTNLDLYAKSILTAAEKGIKIIPVASSGIDKWTEYLLRSEALITGGTYTYITNDSGIGNNHIDATVGDTIVEYLNDMLVRLINEYHTGIIREPIPYNQHPKHE